MFLRLALSFLLQTISLYKDKCIANSGTSVTAAITDYITEHRRTVIQDLKNIEKKRHDTRIFSKSIIRKTQVKLE